MTGYPPNPPYGPPGPGYPPPYPQQPYPQQPYPQQPYPQQPQYYPPQPPPQYYPPAPPPQPYYPPQQQGGAPFVIPLVGTGAARIAAIKGVAMTVTPQYFGIANKKGRGWQLAWTEVTRVVVTMAYHQGIVGSHDFSKTWRVRLIMDIADESSFHRIPEMGQNRGKFGAQGPMQVGLGLGPIPNVVQTMAHALGTYGGTKFGGVIDEGQVIGFGYL